MIFGHHSMLWVICSEYGTEHAKYKYYFEAVRKEKKNSSFINQNTKHALIFTWLIDSL